MHNSSVAGLSGFCTGIGEEAQPVITRAISQASEAVNVGKLAITSIRNGEEPNGQDNRRGVAATGLIARLGYRTDYLP